MWLKSAPCPAKEVWIPAFASCAVRGALWGMTDGYAKGDLKKRTQFVTSRIRMRCCGSQTLAEADDDGQTGHEESQEDASTEAPRSEAASFSGWSKLNGCASTFPPKGLGLSGEFVSVRTRQPACSSRIAMYRPEYPNAPVTT